MTKPKVTLVTCSSLPNLDEDELALPDALAERGMDPQIVAWDDPDFDWETSGTSVVRSVRDYANRRSDFIQWAKRVPRLINSADVIEWNSDKHYLNELAKRGMPVIPTIWLEPGQNLTKHQVHTRIPAHGDFVLKPAVGSGARGTGRYTATKAPSRQAAILHAQSELSAGHSVMVQRYLEEIDRQGEISLIYLNGLASYKVEKQAMLHHHDEVRQELREEVVHIAQASEEEWRWGEQIRQAIHSYIRDRLGRDELLLYNRVDLVRADKGSGSEFYVMEVSLIDASLYLSQDSSHLNAFADAIGMRVFW